MGYRPGTIFLPLGVLVALGACSAETAAPRQQASSERSFSAEDKRVSRALLIGSEIQHSSGTPQYEATLCSLALDEIVGKLQEGDVLSARQLQAFGRAQALFKERAAAGLSPEEREKTRRDVEVAYPDPADRVRFATGCLRKLAQSG